jgi:hypothetical protein
MLRRHHTQPIGVGKVPERYKSPTHAGFSLLWQAAKNAKKRSKIKPSAEGVADGATSLESDVTVNIPAHCRFYVISALPEPGPLLPPRTAGLFDGIMSRP